MGLELGQLTEVSERAGLSVVRERRRPLRGQADGAEGLDGGRTLQLHGQGAAGGCSEDTLIPGLPARSGVEA